MKNKKMIKLALFSPGFLPVPAVKGGAIEQLITDIVYENERNPIFDIDLYTIDNPKLNTFGFKYTNLIKIKNPRKKTIPYFFYAVIKLFYLFTHKPMKYSFMGRNIAKAYKEDTKYDAVLIENNMDVFNALCPKLKNEKKIFHLHNDFNDNDQSKTIYKTNIVIKKADTVIAVSEFIEEKLKKFGADNVKMIPNCIEKSNFRNLTSEEKEKERGNLSLNKDDFVCTYIGRIDREKGIEEYLQAMSLLKNNKKVKGLVVGRIDSKYALRLKKDARSKNIIFVGYVPNNLIYKILSISDCIVIPTQVEEAFGVTALEAMYMKIPIISSDSGNLPYLLRNSNAPIVKRNKDFVVNLAKKTSQISSSSQERKHIGVQEYNNSQKYPLTRTEYFKEFVKLFYKDNVQ